MQENTAMLTTVKFTGRKLHNRRQISKYYVRLPGHVRRRIKQFNIVNKKVGLLFVVKKIIWKNFEKKGECHSLLLSFTIFPTQWKVKNMYDLV